MVIYLRPKKVEKTSVQTVVLKIILYRKIILFCGKYQFFDLSVEMHLQLACFAKFIYVCASQLNFRKKP